MKIKYITGHYSLSVDNKEFIDLPIEKQKEVLHKCIDDTSSMFLQDMLERFMEYSGERAETFKCEDCGEYIEMYTLEVND